MARRMTIALGGMLLAACGQDASQTDVAASEETAASWQSTARHTGQSSYNGPKTATVRWKLQYWSGGQFRYIPQNFTFDSSGRVYIHADRKLRCLKPDGTVVWTTTTSGAGATSISPDEKTVHAAAGMKLVAYSSSGSLQWTDASATHQIYDEPVVASTGEIYFGSWDSYVYSVKSDGTFRWKYQTDGAIAPLAATSLSPDEKTLYVGSGDPNHDNGGTLYALNVDGTLQWKKQVDPIRASGPVVGSDGSIYVTGQRMVHKFSADGTKLWSSADETASSLRPGLSKSGTIYSTTGPTGRLYALDASTGKTKWFYQTGINESYDPSNPKDPDYGVLTAPVIGADGIVYFGSVDGKMYAVDPDGSLVWSYKTGDNIDENTPAIGSDGTLYFSSQDGYIYAVKDE